MMLGITLLSFTLLSAAFMLLSYRYVISEKRDSMERNAGYIANFTSSYYQQYNNIQGDLAVSANKQGVLVEPMAYFRARRKKV